VVDPWAVTSCPLRPFREHFRDLRGALHDARHPTAELCRMVWIYLSAGCVVDESVHQRKDLTEMVEQVRELFSLLVI
jgi:hypothetical protein